MGFLRRQAVIAALTANAVRPIPGFRIGIPAFFAGGIFGELAPHALALTVADAALHATTPGRRERDRRGLALAALSSAGLAFLVVQSRRVGTTVEDALEEGLGLDYVEQLDAVPTPAELATPWRKLVNPFRSRDAAVRVERDIAYGEAGRRNLLDVYLPASGTVEKAPVLLQVHGGAWMFGSKDLQGIPLMQHLAARGWVCVAINYRLSPRAAWPAHIVDVKRAIAWIHENIAAYGGDPDYVAITGGSAGGHLTALAALTPNDARFQPGFEDADTSVAVAVPHYGIYDMAGATTAPNVEKLRDLFLAPRVMQTTWAEHPETFEAASPVLHLSAEAPAMFVLHGTIDTLVPVHQAREFVARLRGVSQRAVVYAELPGAQHAFDVLPSIRSQHVVRAIDRFLHWHWNGYRTATSTLEP